MKLLACLLLPVATLSGANFKFATVISDNAVLQRDVAAPVWGFGEAGKTVEVALNGTPVGSAVVDAEGRWTVRLPVQKANKQPSRISATCDGKTIEIANILFGDVWFGCGQSNMAYTFNGYGRLPIGGEAFIRKAAGNPCIRTLLMNDKANKNCGSPRQDALEVAWETSTPESIRKNGAALYWMGYKLNQALDVPIGLVNASWGATKIDGWIDSVWGEEHGIGYAQGISRYWRGRWRDFMKQGGPEGWAKRKVEYNRRYNPAANFLKESPGYVEGTPTLHDVAFDDSAWKRITLGGQGFWAEPFPTNFSGEVWMRAVFEFTAEDVKQNWAIGYDESYGTDMTWLNGRAFGGSGSRKHGYGVPQSEYRVGKNVLCVQYKVDNVKPGEKKGLYKPLELSVWPPDPKAKRIPLDFKACFGEPKPQDLWRHPEANDPVDARQVSMWSATSMHNGLVEPLYPMALKGCVWYQGCSDLGNGKYDELFQTLVGAWRARFTYKDKLPVIITEIAPHQLDTKPNSQGRIDAGETKKPTWSVNADMRRDLNELGERIPDCGTVSLLDLGEKDIHPIRKEEVGERYCKWALQHVYGKDIEGSCPVVASVEWVGPKAILHLKHAKGLKTSDGKAVTGFELSGPPEKTVDDKGKDREGVRLFSCEAKIVGETIELSCPAVKEAFSFRYAWFDLNLGWNVVNGAGLPLGTCRGYKDGKYHGMID